TRPDSGAVSATDGKLGENLARPAGAARWAGHQTHAGSVHAKKSGDYCAQTGHCSIRSRSRTHVMNNKRIMDIELLRAIAVLGVLFHHLQGSMFPTPVPLLEAINAHVQSWWGVDLFFVISGYVIARSLIPVLQRCTSGQQFW